MQLLGYETKTAYDEQAKSFFDKFTKISFLFLFHSFYSFIHLMIFLHNHLIINNFIARYSSSFRINSVINKIVATVATQ